MCARKGVVKRALLQLLRDSIRYMTDAEPPGSGDAETDEQVDAVVRVAQVAMAVVARSLAAVEEAVTQPQLRVLVMISTRGQINVSTVAEALGVHPSNATRTCDALVRAGLVRRREAPDDRRHVSLTLTAKGKRLVERVLQQRRAAFQTVVTAMRQRDRNQVRAIFTAFADAAEDVVHDKPG